MCWLNPLPPWGASHLPSSPKPTPAACSAGGAAPPHSPRALIVTVNGQLEEQVSSHPCANPAGTQAVPILPASRLPHPGVKAAGSRNSQQQDVTAYSLRLRGNHSRALCRELRSAAAFGFTVTLRLHPLGFVGVSYSPSSENSKL